MPLLERPRTNHSVRERKVYQNLLGVRCFTAGFYVVRLNEGPACAELRTSGLYPLPHLLPLFPLLPLLHFTSSTSCLPQSSRFPARRRYTPSPARTANHSAATRSKS